MTNLVFLNNNNEVVTDSLLVAEVFGKEHRNVMQSIRKLQEELESIGDYKGVLNFQHTVYKHEQNDQMYPKCNITKDGFALLAMGFTGKKALEFKMKYIKEFNRMEEYIKTPQQLKPIDQIKLLLANSVDTEERLSTVEGNVETLQNTMTIDYREQSVLNQAKKRRVEIMWKERGELSKYDTKQKMHSGAWKDVYIRFGVASYRDIAKVDFDNALNFINLWIPLSF
ncbi:transcriptional regulator [Bacillus cereus]|uniref:Rha family transcriptional regulator n=1 Tax=Bacillus cereus TaxID=1396 RepID=UPI000BF4468A|nr:Rha family transcriptional regulator [Bacillus cereus]PFO63251.1 transcriptional regulator [Bacillus cereus]